MQSDLHIHTYTHIHNEATPTKNTITTYSKSEIDP